MRVKVSSKVPGANGDILPEVLVDLEADVTTAGELIRRAVQEQVRLLSSDAARGRRALDRQYLSTEDIRAQAAAGVVRMPARVSAERDTAEEVERAQRAFERNVFALFAGGRQLRRLDEVIVLRLGEPVVFVRLTPLAGG